MGVLPVQPVEGRDLGALLRICAHDAHTGKVFLCARGDLRKEILNLLEPAVHLLAEDFYRERNQRHGHEQQQRQFPIDYEQKWHQYDHREQCLRRVHDRRADQLPYGGEIVGRAGHQIAGAVLLEKRQRLIDQVSIKVLAQIVFNMTRDAIDEAALQKKKEAPDSAETQDLERGNSQLGPGYLAPFGINRFADNQRDAEVESDVRDNAADADDQRKPIRPKIAREFSQIVHESKDRTLWPAKTARGRGPGLQLAKQFQSFGI